MKSSQDRLRENCCNLDVQNRIMQNLLPNLQFPAIHKSTYFAPSKAIPASLYCKDMRPVSCVSSQYQASILKLPIPHAKLVTVGCFFDLVHPAAVTGIFSQTRWKAPVVAVHPLGLWNLPMFLVIAIAKEQTQQLLIQNKYIIRENPVHTNSRWFWMRHKSDFYGSCKSETQNHP